MYHIDSHHRTISGSPAGRRRIARLLAVASLTLVWITSTAIAQDTIDPADDGSQYAWSENTGWLNAEPTGDGGPGARISQTGATGWLWSENIGWISLNCRNTASCATVDYGVAQDGSGNLAGFAWAENAGWVSFACENTDSCATVDYGVTIDPASGEFTGYAWAANLGWISFSCDNTSSCAAIQFRVRTDIPFIDDELIFADGFESGS